MSKLLDLLFGKEVTGQTPSSTKSINRNVKKVASELYSKFNSRGDYSDKFVCNHVIEGNFFKEIKRGDEHYLVDVYGNVKPMVDQLGRHVRG